MRKPATTGASSALVIPFPRFRIPANRRTPANFGTPDFDAGFEFAMMFVRNLKASGHLSHLKGA